MRCSGLWREGPGTRSPALPLWVAGAPNPPHLVSEDHQAIVRLALMARPTLGGGRMASKVRESRFHGSGTGPEGILAVPVGAEMGPGRHTSPRGGLHVRPPVPARLTLRMRLWVDVGHPEHDDGPPVIVQHCGARGSERGLIMLSPGALKRPEGSLRPCWVPRDGGRGGPLCVQDGGWVGEVPSGNRNGHTWQGRAKSTHPKSIPR